MTKINDLGASKKAIEHHYDLSNEFYQLWLDQTMTYTSALFKSEGITESLEQAQKAKIDFYASYLTKKEGLNNVCDIGCGWGGALKHLISNYNVKEGIGLTLSTEQAKFINAQKEIKGLKILVESWVNHHPKKLYDGLISIEAFEAFARLGLSEKEKHKVYRTFFKKCHNWLNDGSYFGLQTIAFGNSKESDFDGFIAEEIFPESVLPTMAEIFNATHQYFEPIIIKNDRNHYARTLKIWLKNLKSNREKALTVVGEKIVVRYERYLRLCIYMFEEGTCDLLRIVLKKINHPRL